jgi:GTP-binding protein LepA
VLLVDAAQGIEAQTLANCYLALENDLEIVAALNKIDLPGRRARPVRREIEPCSASRPTRSCASRQDRRGRPELLDAVVERIPRPGRSPTPRCRR